MCHHQTKSNLNVWKALCVFKYTLAYKCNTVSKTFYHQQSYIRILPPNHSHSAIEMRKECNSHASSIAPHIS